MAAPEVQRRFLLYIDGEKQAEARVLAEHGWQTRLDSERRGEGEEKISCPPRELAWGKEAKRLGGVAKIVDSLIYRDQAGSREAEAQPLGRKGLG